MFHTKSTKSTKSHAAVCFRNKSLRLSDAKESFVFFVLFV